MTEETQNSVRHHLAAIGRDILVLGSLCAMLGGIIITVSRPYWEPFAAMPENVATIQRQILEIQRQMAANIRPEIVDFRTAIAVEDQVLQGGNLTVLYHLRRNASCATAVEPIFLNVDVNLPVYGTEFGAQRAPVTDEFINFPITVAIPRNMPPGRYVYTPRITPEQCGVYGQMRVMPTTVFEVVARPAGETP
jgi:hypothetical protein